MLIPRARTLVCLALFAAPAAFAQQAPPPPAQGRMEMGGPKGPRGDGGTMGIVPPGTWWANPSTITALSLSADQQKRLSDTFLQSRIQLIHMHASLEEEQLKLQPLLAQNPPDQGKALGEISRIADLRADLEKANAKMLLSMRGVLTADQWTRLQAMAPPPAMGRGPRDGKDGRKGDRGRRGPGGPGDMGGSGGNLGTPPTPPPAAE